MGFLNKFQDIKNKVGETASNVGEKISEATSNAGQAISQTAANTKVKVAEKASIAKESLKETASNVGGKICDTASNVSEIISQTATYVNENVNVFGIMAGLKEYAVLIVFMLRDNAPEKLLNQLSKLPVLGGPSAIAKFIMGTPMRLFNELMVSQGESYVMQNLIKEWNTRNITSEYLVQAVDNLPVSVIDSGMKNSMRGMLYKYYTDDATLAIENKTLLSIENGKISCQNCGIEVSTDTKFCPECGTQITIPVNVIQTCPNCGTEISDNTKFCPECGTKITRELKCKSCGNTLEENAKFCPECGTKAE